MRDYRMHYSRELCAGINERNARTSSRAEAACGVLLAVAIGVLGAVALVYWFACEVC